MYFNWTGDLLVFYSFHPLFLLNIQTRAYGTFITRSHFLVVDIWRILQFLKFGMLPLHANGVLPLFVLNLN